MTKYPFVIRYSSFAPVHLAKRYRLVQQHHGNPVANRVDPATVETFEPAIVVEVHNNPSEALSDKDQAMTPEMFARLMKKLETLRPCVNKLNGRKG